MSGGRTSAYMTKRLLEEYSDKFNIVVCFANTGQENDKTLDFVHNCDNEFNFNTVWLEVVVHDGKVGCTYKVVDYETASRKGEPFIEVVKKYGVPNKGYPHCTRELKESPIHSYVSSIGWKKGEYFTALGIRIDEPKRINRNETPQNKIYPMVDLFPADKIDVMDFWQEQSFDLGLHDYQGNCTWCYKKSQKKHFQLLKDDIANFDFPEMLEKKYGHIGNNKINGVLVDFDRTIFRNYMTAEKLKQLYLDTEYRQMSFDDEMLEGCAESCEPFAR